MCLTPQSDETSETARPSPFSHLFNGSSSGERTRTRTRIADDIPTVFKISRGQCLIAIFFYMHFAVLRSRCPHSSQHFDIIAAILNTIEIHDKNRNNCRKMLQCLGVEEHNVSNRAAHICRTFRGANFIYFIDWKIFAIDLIAFNRLYARARSKVDLFVFTTRTRARVAYFRVCECVCSVHRFAHCFDWMFHALSCF